VFEDSAFEVLHGDEGLRIGLANIINGADGRMVKSGRRFGFAAKASLGVASDFFREKFESDEAVQASVLSL